MALKRRLTFFRWEDLVEDEPFDRVGTAREIANLPADDRKAHYGEFWIDVIVVDEGSDTSPTKLLLLRLRDYDNRPYVYAPSEGIHPVGIERHQAITDVAHLMLFPDNILAVDQGGHAPRPSALSWYTAQLCDAYVQIVALYDPTLVERIKKLKGIRSVEFGIKNSDKMQHHLNAEKGMLSGLISSAFDRTDHAIVKTTVGVDTRGKGGRLRVLPEDVTKEIIQHTEQAEEHFDTLTIVGVKPEGGSVSLDLIRERLQVEVDLPRAEAGGHLPDSEAAFSELAAAKRRLDQQGDIEAATEALAPPAGT